MIMVSLTRKGPSTTIAEFANTVDSEEPSHLDLHVHCLPSSLRFSTFYSLYILKVFRNFVICFLGALGVNIKVILINILNDHEGMNFMMYL